MTITGIPILITFFIISHSNLTPSSKVTVVNGITKTRMVKTFLLTKINKNNN